MTTASGTGTRARSAGAEGAEPQGGRSRGRRKPVKRPPQTDSPLYAEAHRLDLQVRQLCQRRRLDKVEVAYMLLDIKERGLYRVLGYAGMGHYGSEVNGLGASTTSELITVAAGARTLPHTRAAFQSGKLPSNKAVVIVGVATPETEEEWLRHSDEHDAPGLRSLATEGEARRRVQGYVLPSQQAWMDECVRVVRETGGPIGYWDALSEACRRFVQGEAVGLVKEPGSRTGVRPLLVMRQRPGGEFTRETSRGPVPVDEETLAWARREGTVYDLSQGPPQLPQGEEIKRAIPQAVRAYVDARDGDRCIYPACTHRSFLEADHFDGWKNGHDPRRIGKLCSEHHGQRGLGGFRVETGDDDVMRFFLHDGTFVGVAGARQREDVKRADAQARELVSAKREDARCEFVSTKREDSRAEFVSTKREDSRAEFVSTKPSEVEYAFKALVRLEFKKGEAKALLARALEAWPELAETDAGEIVRVALGGWEARE